MSPAESSNSMANGHERQRGEHENGSCETSFNALVDKIKCKALHVRTLVGRTKFSVGLVENLTMLLDVSREYTRGADILVLNDISRLIRHVIKSLKIYIINIKM